MFDSDRDVRVVGRVSQLLEQLSNSGSCSLSELSEGCGLAVSTSSRLLDSLEHHGLVERDPGTKRYQMGRTLFRLVAASKPRKDVVSLLRPVLKWLVEQTGEDCGLSELQGTHAAIIDLVEGAHPLKIIAAIRGPEPLYCGAFRKVLLAHQDDSWIDSYIASITFKKFTPTTIANASQLRREIAQIRRQGYATSFGERLSDAGGIAVPVTDYIGKIRAAIQIVAPISRLKPTALKHYIEAMKIAGDRATTLLGGTLSRVDQRTKQRVKQVNPTRRTTRYGTVSSAS